jgi:putative methionine-R-sulfoxide reductase with GAF domain
MSESSGGAASEPRPRLRRPKIVPDANDKPVLDEQTFGRLLEAAFVLQEHNRALHKLERNLEVHSDHLAAAEVAAPKTSLAILPAPDSPAPEPLPQELSAQEPIVEQYFPTEPGPPIQLEPEPAEPAPAAPAPAQSAPQSDYSITLAQIVETQRQIQVRHLELENAMSLVAERVTEIARAGGAAIAFIDGKKVRYRGVAGSMTLPAGTEVPFEKALSVASLKTGQVIRCADVSPEFLFDPEECRRRGIQAMIAVPIFHEGGIAGALELYYATTQAFTEQDVHTCQLMAGLITEALARDEEVGWKKSLASERAVMLEALEKLKPKLAALADTAAAKGSTHRKTASRVAVAAASSTSTYVCRKCGHQLVGGEQFCGSCGSRREGEGSVGRSPDPAAGYEAPSMQSRTASLWHMEESIPQEAAAAPANGRGREPLVVDDPSRPERPLADSIEEEMPELFAAPELRIGKMSEPEEFHEAQPGESLAAKAKPEIVIPPQATAGEVVSDHAEQNIEQNAKQHEEGEQEIAPAETALVKPLPTPNWSSATTARQFFEQLAGSDRPGGLVRFWKARRGDIYLAVAVVLVAGVIRWGIWSNHSVSATGKPPAVAGHRNPAPEPDLSLFDRMLISLGLAEAPPTPESHGNPDAQVWVDTRTALYYCPGADLYGKTPKGKFTSQRDAQLDQYEPAYRKACD